MTSPSVRVEEVYVHVVLEQLKVERMVTDAKRRELFAMESGVHVDEGAVDFDNPLAELEVYFDNIIGAMLDPLRIKAARQEEVDFVHEFDVDCEIPRASAVGVQFVVVKWSTCTVEINSGPEQEPLGSARTKNVGHHRWSV